MNHLAIKNVLEEAERYTREYSKQLGIRYETIEQNRKQYGYPADYEEQQKTEARLGLFDSLNLDYDGEELVKAMEEADKRLEKHGAATEARAIVSVIDSHRETFDLIAPPMARKLYDEFCLLAEPQQRPNDTPKHYSSSKSKEALTTTFENLKKDGYFADDSNLETWLYICGVGDLKEEFRPLDWKGQQRLLGWMVYVLFTTDNRLWETLKICFTVKGNTPNINSIKNAVSRIHNQWDDVPTEFENLLKA